MHKVIYMLVFFYLFCFLNYNINFPIVSSCGGHALAEGIHDS